MWSGLYVSGRARMRSQHCAGTRYEFQCQFGSIGWAVGATLGYSIGLGPKKRLIASIGDGSFQVRSEP